MPQGPVGQHPLQHMLEQLFFELSTDGSGRVRVDVDASGCPVVHIGESGPRPAGSGSAEQALQALSAAGRCIVLDLSGCAYLSSSDLALVARLGAVQQAHGGHIVVKEASSQAQKLMAMVGLPAVFRMEEAPERGGPPARGRSPRGPSA